MSGQSPLILLHLLLLHLLLLSLLVVTHTTQVTTADAVKITVYYETLCPDSKLFINTQLYPVYKELGDIMNIDLNAYGKAKDFPLGDSYVFLCQHGNKECVGNMMMTCAKNITTDQQALLGFTDCIMREFDASAAGEKCAQENGIDFATVSACYKSTEGHLLLHEVGVKQGQLVPSLTYVPWILINDVFTQEQLEEAQKNLKKVVCDAYTGLKPDPCV